MNISYYRNITRLRAFNGFELRYPAPPFGAIDLCNQIMFFRFKFYSRPLASQALVWLVLRDKIALAFKKSVTAANTAYMQWRVYDSIKHSTSPNCIFRSKLTPHSEIIDPCSGEIDPLKS